ncbi:putative polysaccharide biosynthesis protein [Natranaerobius trueperi]|uniref:Stage V sporulation protein B n=1 Tax=Natranaerobius trueperi TaxID=759412 RepID=A0A226BXH8_9FIRM|nr:polysaccharide biosynthesis protein [Natranaerobius trueperi]OWZ83621.1 stage V sporulation protein B [Natranaerobius trueperi]
MQKDSLVKGTAALSVGMLIAKVFGLIYRLILPNMIGTKAMGLYGMAYSVYTILLTVSMAGIPVAISKLISNEIAVNNYKNALKVFKTAFIAISLTGLIFSIILFFGASFFAERITGDSRAYLSLRAVAPAILLVSLMSSIRGYFQGLRKMTYTAVSQLLEQLFRVFGIILFAFLLLPYGETYAAAGAAFGNVLGAFVGLLYLSWNYFNIEFPKTDQLVPNFGSNLEIIKQIFYLSFPIIIGNLIMPIMNLIDATVVVNRLIYSGFSQDQATTMFAHLTQYANPLIMFPGTLGMALAMSLVPVVSENYTQGDVDKLNFIANLSLRLSIIIGVPSFIGLLFLAGPIVTLIFPNDPEASIPLRYLSPVVVFLIIKFATTGILQGLEKTMVPVRNLFKGAIFKFIITFLLTSLPVLNIRGAAIGTLVSYIVATAFNLKDVRKYIHFGFSVNKDIIKPLIASIIMGCISYFTYEFLIQFIGTRFSTLMAVIIGVITYSILMLSLKVVTTSEIEFIPKVGPKIVRLLNKFNYFKT